MSAGYSSDSSMWSRCRTSEKFEYECLRLTGYAAYG